jgi:hypothetical protein
MQVTFVEAISLANAISSPKVGRPWKSADTNCTGVRLLPLASPPVNSVSSLHSELPGALENAGDASTSISRAQFDNTCLTGSTAFRVSALYSLLGWEEFHHKVLMREHDAALRLVGIEKLRIKAHVDEGILLLRANLLGAESRVRLAHLESELQELHDRLGQNLGIGDFQPVLASIPPPPVIEVCAAGNLGSLNDLKEREIRLRLAELCANRDAVQIRFALATRDSLRAVGLGTAPLNEQLAGEIRKDEAFDNLLVASANLVLVKLQLLDSSHGLDNWEKSTALDGDDQPRIQPPPGNRARHAGGLLLLPASELLKALQSRQFAAVSTGIGGGKDVTTIAHWTSSDESVAIVSSTGLLTGLREGTVILSATAGDQVKEKQITVTAADE